MILGYNSIFDVLRDVPLTPVIASIIVALLPLTLYRLWKASTLEPFFGTASSFLHTLGSAIYAYRGRRELDRRTNIAYTRIAGRKLEITDLVNYGTYLVLLFLVVFVLKEALFFGLVASWSMAPTLMPTDLVLVESLTGNNIEVGDIIMYTRSKGYPPVIHRVVAISEEGIKTKGDNAPVDSWTVRRKDIKGKAVVFNGRPVVIKNVGTYFVADTTPVPIKDPTFEFIKNTVKTIHIYGPVILAIFLLFIMFGSFRTKKAYV